MVGVFFVNFPKPKTQREKCEGWIRRCDRPIADLNVERVNRMTFICSKHFVGNNGPTSDHPDPIPATACPQEVSAMLRKTNDTRAVLRLECSLDCLSAPTYRYIAPRMIQRIILKFCGYVGCDDATNVSNFGYEPIKFNQLNQ